MSWFAVVEREDHEGNDLEPVTFGPYSLRRALAEVQSDEGDVFWAVTEDAKKDDYVVTDAYVSRLCSDCRMPIDQREHKAMAAGGENVHVWTILGTDTWVCPKTNNEHQPVEEDDVCRFEDCEESLDDGEGWDGYCGNHADKVYGHEQDRDDEDIVHDCDEECPLHEPEGTGS
jgi:hypothetical protein